MDKLEKNLLISGLNAPRKTGLRLNLANSLNFRLLIGAILLLLIIHAFNTYFTLGAFYELTGKAISANFFSLSRGKALQFQSAMYQTNLKIIFFTLMSGIMMLAIAVGRIPITPDKSSFPKKTTALVIFLIIALTQVISSGLSFLVFNDTQIQITKETGSAVSIASKWALSDQSFEVILDTATILAISFLFLAELLILLFKYIDKHIEKSVSFKQQTIKIHYSLVRPAIFMFLFSADLSMAFLPLHMETLYEPLLGLPKDIILGLPISVEFFCVGIAIFISGAWVDRRGWHEPFLTGLALVGIGGLYSWLAYDAVHFITSRGIIGIGYGLTLMASQGFVITYTDSKNKAQGLAYFIAGLYAGSICGTATGAILAERVGYSMVFLIGALIVFFVFLYVFLFMRAAFQKPIAESVSDKSPNPKKGKKFIEFITNRTVLSLIFFSSFPTAIAAIGFLNYFSPIYLNRLGASESTIGRILMIYGVCLIYIGPYISKYIDASENKRAYIFLGCLLGSCSFLIFNFLGGFAAAIIAVFLLGLSNCLVLASQSAYTLSLKVTREFGESKSIGLFRATSRIGQMLGPIVFSSVILSTNINQGITYLGLLYLITALLFLLLTQTNKQTLGRANS